MLKCDWSSNSLTTRCCICFVCYFNCNILTLDRAVNQETGASGRRYRNITLTCGRGWIRCRCVRSQEHLYNQVPQTALVSWSSRRESVRVAVSSSSRQWVPAVGVRGKQTVSSGQFELEFQSQLETGCPRNENQLQTEGLDLQDPGWAAQQNEEEVLL